MKLNNNMEIAIDLEAKYPTDEYQGYGTHIQLVSFSPWPQK
jgi:hypothetical protein